MQFHTSDRISALDRLLGASLAASLMFVIGYTATRVYLNQPSSQNTIDKSIVIPHEATLWSDLGR